MTTPSTHLAEFLETPMAQAVTAEMGDEVFMRLAFLEGSAAALAFDFDIADIEKLTEETEPCQRKTISNRRQPFGLN